jgi:hypothetical protein
LCAKHNVAMMSEFRVCRYRMTSARQVRKKTI